DGKSVFVHIPDLEPTMQVELSHRFRIRGAEGEPAPIFFSALELFPVPWIELGFDPPQLEGSVARVRAPDDDAVPTAARGAEIAVRFGCVACHSVTPDSKGHSGPSWVGLFGSVRKFADG